MTRLNQVIALETGAKQEAEKAKEAARHKSALLPQMAGLTRTYSPRDDEGDQLPAEQTRVQVNVLDIIEEFSAPLSRLMDLVATKEHTNQLAVADVVVDGHSLLTNMPVTVLLFLERQLDDLKAIVSGFPVLDPAESWTAEEPGVYRTQARRSVRTVKLPKAFVRYEATKEHPAQVDAYTEDKVVGDWETVKFSGAIEAAEKVAILERIRRLRAAVLLAREEANSVAAVDTPVGDEVLGFIFR